MTELLAAIQGFAIGGSLIVAIGAQNAFVLRQALMGQHVLPVVLFCFAADTILVILGALGIGALVRGSEGALAVIAFGGGAFLFWHGLKALSRAMNPGTLVAGTGTTQTMQQALVTVAGVTLLNPHVYLDTMIFVGGISASYPPALQSWFISGVIIASFVWFFTLGYGGQALSPLFRNPNAWRVLDMGIAAVMWLIAGQLFLYGLSLNVFP